MRRRGPRSSLLRPALALGVALQPGLAYAGPLLPKPLSATVNTEGYHQTVTGDGGRSFLKNGNFQKTNIDLALNHSFKKDSSLTGQLNLQSSDDPLIVGNESHFKAVGGFIAMEKKQQAQIQAGYLIPKATRATLTSTVLGLGGYLQFNAPKTVMRITFIGGQITPPLEGSRFQRGVAGASWTSLHRGDYGRSKFHANFYRIEDLENSLKHRLGLARLALFAYSVGGEINSRSGLGLASEAAWTQSDKGSTVLINGSSVRISPSFQGELFSAAGNFERTTPRFRNPAASVAADAKKIDGNLTFGKVNQVSLNSLYTQNNVQGQLAATARTQSVGAAAKLVPFQEAAFWKALSMSGDYDVSRSKTTGSNNSEVKRAGLAVSFNDAAINTTIRGDYSLQRDFLDASTDRDTYRATWQMGLKLTNRSKLNFDPDWALSIERSKRLANGLVDQGASASGGFTATYSNWLTLGARHSFDQRVSKPSGRKIRNNSTQGSLRFLIKIRVPIEIGISAARKHFYDTALNAFGEEEIRGTLNVKF